MNKMMKKLMFFMVISLSLNLVFAYTEQIQGDEDKIVYTASVFQGWNILNGGLYALNHLTSESDIKSDDIVAVYYYSPSQKQFIRIHPDLENAKFQNEENFYGSDKSLLFSSAVWAYIKRDGMIQYETDDSHSMTKRSLTSGWNFLSVTWGALGKSLNEMKGDCQIYNAYYYFKEYKKLDLDVKLSNDMASHGLLIRVINDCHFGSPGKVDSSLTPPPSLPLDTDYPEGQTSICEDSDGYDLYTVGKTSYGGESGVTGGKEDYCDFYAKGAESRIGLLREGYCDGKTYKEDLVKCGNGYVCRSGKCVQGDSSLSMCSETDSGKDAFTAGKTVGIGGQGEDDCAFSNANGVGLTDECSGEGCSVYENYCNEEEIATEIIPCSNGCKNRACIT